MTGPHHCSAIASAIADPSVPLVYIAKERKYAIRYISDPSIQLVSVCPFCGARLPPPLGDQWMDQLHSRGFELGDELPPDLESDAWWSGTELDAWVPAQGSTLAFGKRRDVHPVRRDISDDELPHACQMMAYACDEGGLPIAYTAEVRVYAIEYQDTGEKGLMIEFCPFCGARLPTD